MDRADCMMAKATQMIAAPLLRCTYFRMVGMNFLLYRMAISHRAKDGEKGTAPGSMTDRLAQIARCDHMKEDGSGTSVARYGNQSGRFAKCNRCQAPWKWATVENRWVVCDSSLRGPRRLPLPSAGLPSASSSAAPSSRPMTPKTKARPKSNSQNSSTSSRPTPSPWRRQPGDLPEEYPLDASEAGDHMEQDHERDWFEEDDQEWEQANYTEEDSDGHQPGQGA